MDRYFWNPNMSSFRDLLTNELHFMSYELHFMSYELHFMSYKLHFTMRVTGRGCRLPINTEALCI